MLVQGFQAVGSAFDAVAEGLASFFTYRKGERLNFSLQVDIATFTAVEQLLRKKLRERFGIEHVEDMPEFWQLFKLHFLEALNKNERKNLETSSSEYLDVAKIHMIDEEINRGLESCALKLQLARGQVLPGVEPAAPQQAASPEKAREEQSLDEMIGTLRQLATPVFQSKPGR